MQGCRSDKPIIPVTLFLPFSIILVKVLFFITWQRYDSEVYEKLCRLTPSEYLITSINSLCSGKIQENFLWGPSRRLVLEGMSQIFGTSHSSSKKKTASVELCLRRIAQTDQELFFFFFLTRLISATTVISVSLQHPDISFPLQGLLTLSKICKLFHSPTAIIQSA